jgi:hypothetical protein
MVYGAAAFGFDPSGASLAFIAPKAATAQAVRLSRWARCESSIPARARSGRCSTRPRSRSSGRRTARRSQCSRSTSPAGAASRQRTRSWRRARHPPPPTRASVSTSDSWRCERRDPVGTTGPAVGRPSATPGQPARPPVLSPNSFEGLLCSEQLVLVVSLDPAAVPVRGARPRAMVGLRRHQAGGASLDGLTGS